LRGGGEGWGKYPCRKKRKKKKKKKEGSYLRPVDCRGNHGGVFSWKEKRKKIEKHSRGNEKEWAVTLKKRSSLSRVSRAGRENTDSSGKRKKRKGGGGKENRYIPSSRQQGDKKLVGGNFTAQDQKEKKGGKKKKKKKKPAHLWAMRRLTKKNKPARMNPGPVTREEKEKKKKSLC